MYDHVQGEVVDKQPARVVLRASGIGFELMVPMGVSASLELSQQVCLYTILHITDGNPTLIGFRSRGEREFARMLMSVAGVGPAMSLAILSTYTVEQVARAIVGDEHKLLRSVKGVGTKTAERLCLELRDKVAKLSLAGIEFTPTVVLMPRSCQDAITALVTLGYSEKEASKKVQHFNETEPQATTEDLIRMVLRD